MPANPFQAAPQGSRVGFACTPTAAAADAIGARVTSAYYRALERGDPETMAELRGATLRFVAMLSAEGLAPEQVLVSLKRVIVHAGWWPSLVLPKRLDPESQPAEHRMYMQVFGWFLEGCFGTTAPAETG